MDRFESASSLSSYIGQAGNLVKVDIQSVDEVGIAVCDDTQTTEQWVRPTLAGDEGACLLREGPTRNQLRVLTTIFQTKAVEPNRMEDGSSAPVIQAQPYYSNQ